MKQSSSPSSIVDPTSIPTWEQLKSISAGTTYGKQLLEEESLRERGAGPPHTDAKIRLFGTTAEPRITLYRDTAAWCPYCQKVWILLEEKKIPYRIQKINMRSYGDKPAEFLRMIPNGLLPAIVIDGKQVQTESLEIMLNLDSMFTGGVHKRMWPAEGSPEAARARTLMKLERKLFGCWCNVVFNGPGSGRPMKQFQDCMTEVDEELKVTKSPWFLEEFSIVDLTYITHIERMCASVAYWCGLKIRGDGLWPAIERWISAFEDMPSYMATKSDFYTHVMDIPPQYGPGYFIDDSARTKFAPQILGVDGGWSLPLPLITRPDAVETIRPENDPGEQAAREEAAAKFLRNNEAIVRFALRGAGSPGAKRFQAPLADPYAVPALEYQADLDVLLRYVITCNFLFYFVLTTYSPH